MSTLPTETDNLALELIEASGCPDRVIAIAARVAALAARIRAQEAQVVPPHLRASPATLPPGVVKLCGRRARL
ncbi:MAG TPA: hypothetical protein VEX11_17765 [Acetobacteraceae bacterium]|nr:hypothetical protein [Acetobacteraceae bacterium]